MLVQGVIDDIWIEQFLVVLCSGGTNLIIAHGRRAGGTRPWVNAKKDMEPRSGVLIACLAFILKTAIEILRKRNLLIHNDLKNYRLLSRALFT